MVKGIKIEPAIKRGLSCMSKLLPIVSLVVVIACGIGFWHFYLTSPVKPSWYRDFLETYTWCNWVATIYLFYVLFVGGFHLMHASNWKAFTLHTIVYASICAACFAVPACYPVHSICGGIYFHWLVALIFGCWFFLELFVLVLHAIIDENPKPQKQNVDVHWKQYVASVISYLDNLPDLAESFTIGISGAWGRGKTTMLDYIKDNLNKDKYIVRSFNPWQVSSPEQVNIEFFEMLMAALRSDYLEESDVLAAIKKYVHLLTLVPNSSVESAEKVINLLPSSSQKTLSALQNEINTSLSRMKKKIVVCIDDLDRLDFEELYEVLKLIRVSANFKKLVFIIAYHKRYVAENLDKHNIPQGEEFMKKIVNLEISLPSYEKYKLTNLLWEKIRAHFGTNEQAIREVTHALWDVQTERGTSLFEEYFTSFRDVERFANYFCVLLEYVNSPEQKADIDVMINYGDLLWIEILHYFNEPEYNKLRENKWSLLVERRSPMGTLMYNEKMELPDRDVICMKYLFPSDMNTRKDTNSICYVSNFDNFFAYTILDNVLPIPEFERFLRRSTSRVDIENQISNWIKGNKMEAFTSLLNHYSFYSRLTEVGVKNYIHTLLYTAKYYPANSPIGKILLEHFKALCNAPFTQMYNLKSAIVKEELSYAINNYNIGEKINHFLTTLTYMYDNDVAPEDQPALSILEEKDVKKLAAMNFAQFINNRKPNPIIELFGSNNPITLFVNSASFVKLYYSQEETRENDVYDNLLDDAMLTIYPAAKKKMGDSEFVTMMYPLTRAIFEDEMDDEIPLLRQMIQRIFGNYDSFNRFVDAHFKLSDEIRAKYITNLGLGNKVKQNN